MKIKKWLNRITTLLLFIFVMSSTQVSAADEFKVHFLNVGQDDSTLITCGEHAMLIDAGGNNDVEPVLNYIQNKQGLTHLDYVIGTHPHEDHIGGLDAVINSVSVDTVMLPDVTTNTQTFMDVLTAIDNNGLSITIPSPGQTYSLGDASFTILAPVKEYGDDLNNWSIALKLTYGDTSFLFTGDAESDAEKDIVDNGIDISADVFKVGHHGSDTSNSDYLLDAVKPSYSVISCGRDNSYGHPNKNALNRLQAHGTQIFRTDGQGTIVASTDGNTISWSTSPSTDWTPGNNITTSNSDSAEISNANVQPENNQSSGTTVHITKTGEKYHSAGCQYLRKSDIEVSLSEAKARGLTPCSKCNPPQ